MNGGRSGFYWGLSVRSGSGRMPVVSQKGLAPSVVRRSQALAESTRAHSTAHRGSDHLFVVDLFRGRPLGFGLLLVAQRFSGRANTHLTHWPSRANSGRDL